MSVTVGSLNISLSASTSTLEHDLGKASALAGRTVADIKRSFQTLATIGLSFGAALTTGLGVMVTKSVEAIGSMSRLAQAAGTTVGSFLTLAYAAKRSHLETEQLAGGMEKLAKASFGAQNGNTTLANVFSRLGVSVSDGNGHLKDTGVLFNELAPKFAAMHDGAGKTALAMQVFGKAGAALIPMLNEYGAHQAEITAEAKRFGVVIGEETAAKVGVFHESLVRLEAAGEGVGLSVTAAMLPALQQLETGLENVSTKINLPDLSKAFGEHVADAIIKIAEGMAFLADNAKTLTVVFGGLAALKFGTMFAPLVRDLTGGGLANLFAGLSKVTLDLFGITGRQIIAFKDMGAGALAAGKGLSEFIQFVGLLAKEEGLASAAQYVLNAAVEVNPYVAAATAIVALGALLYAFRKSLITVGKQQYEIRDIFAAVWLGTKKVVTSVIDDIVYWWHRLTFRLSDISWMKPIFAGFHAIGEFIAKLTGKTIAFVLPQNLLDQAKREREDADRKPAAAAATSPHTDDRPSPDTSGLVKAKPEKDVFRDTLDKIVQVTNAQKALNYVIGQSPEIIQAMTSSMEADALILEKNNGLRDAGKKILTTSEQSQIRAAIVLRDLAKTETAYKQEVVTHLQNAQLQIIQARNLAEAQLHGVEAVRQATIANQILGLTYGKTSAEVAAMSKEIAAAYEGMKKLSSLEVIAGNNQEIKGLQDKTVLFRAETDAIIGGAEAMRRYEIVAATLEARQKLAAATTDKERESYKKLIAEQTMAVRKQQYITREKSAVTNFADPVKVMSDENDELQFQEDLYRQVMLVKATNLQIMQRTGLEQANFNSATEKTINLLLHEGSALDGVKAFFLKMQMQAESAASIIYNSLNDVFNKLAENFAKLLSGQKSSFRESFKAVAESALSATLKKGMQTSVGALGKVFGVDLANASKPDGSTSKPFWVWIKGGVSQVGSMLGIGGDKSNASGASIGYGGGGVGGFFQGLLGALIPHASGGEVNPSSAYLVGEQGPEILTGLSGRITNSTDSMRALGAGGHAASYYIDARGNSNPAETEQRFQRALAAVHGSAVRSSVAVQAEMNRRRPRF